MGNKVRVLKHFYFLFSSDWDILTDLPINYGRNYIKAFGLEFAFITICSLKIDSSNSYEFLE